MKDYIARSDIEKLMRRWEWDTPDERWRPESEFGRMIDAIPAADVVEVHQVKTMNEWISVKERLPAEWKPVLVIGLPIHHIVEAAVYVGNGEWKITWNHDELEGVTNWMPLPELPEDPTNWLLGTH